jgi:hypothetical protein
MRRSLAVLLVALSSVLATTALAAKPPPAKPPATTPAPHKEAMSDSAAIGIILLLLVGGGIFVAVRLVGSKKKGDGRPKEPIAPLRTHDWELSMTEEQERALLRGVEAYRDAGHGLYFSHADAMIYCYEPPMLVSVHALAKGFLASGPAGMSDPIGTVGGLFRGYEAGTSEGALRTRKGWYTAPVDGADASKFASWCHDALTRPRPYIDGSQGSGSDENNGWVYAHLEVGGPKNTLFVDLGQVLAQLQQARASRPGDATFELLRPILSAMSQGRAPGATWSRGAATPAEAERLGQIIATAQPS